MRPFSRLLLAASIILASCNTGPQPKDATETQLRQASHRFSWFATASFAGDVAGMTKFAKENGLELKCEPGGPGVNPITLVQTGQNTFGAHAADEIISAIDKGADLVIIGVVNYNSPGGFASLKDRNIKEPKDLIGKTVGMLPFGSTTLLFESMVRANGLDRSKIKDITVSPDMKLFLTGGYDVHPVFVYDETVTLDDQGVQYDIIEPKDWGVSYRGQCYFTKRSTLEKDPELVKAFIRTMAQGWQYALENQEDAVAMLKAFAPEIDATREAKVLERGAEYFRAYEGRPLDCDDAAWVKMMEELVALKVVRGPMALNTFLNMDAVREYYK